MTNTEVDFKKAQTLHLRLSAVIQRLIIHSIIVLACYYICHVLLKDDGWLDVVYAICWSGNAFLLPDYAKWVTNVP